LDITGEAHLVRKRGQLERIGKKSAKCYITVPEIGLMVTRITGTAGLVPVD